MISSKEIRGMSSLVLARRFIAEVGELRDECTNAPMGMQRGWEIHVRKLEERVLTTLNAIKGLLTLLPVSKRPVIQAIVSSVCEDAHLVTKNVLEYTNFQSNNNKTSRFNGQFPETIDAGFIQSILSWFQQTKNRLNQLPN